MQMFCLDKFPDPAELFRRCRHRIGLFLPDDLAVLPLPVPAVLRTDREQDFRIGIGQIGNVFRAQSGQKSLRQIGADQIFLFKRSGHKGQRRILQRLPA